MKAKKNTPILRFPEYKEDWIPILLGEMCSLFKSGNGITSKDIGENGLYPVYGGNGLRGYTDTFTHNGNFILIGRQGALCGNIVTTTGKAFISEHAIAVQTNDKADIDWLAQKLDFMNLNQYSESSAQPGLAVNKLIRLKVIVPSHSEQQKMAAFLTSIDNKVQHLTRKKQLLEQYKKGCMEQIFSQNIRFKDVNKQHTQWKFKRLKEIGQFFSGGTPLTSKKEYYGGGIIPFIKSGEINSNQTEQCITELGLKNSSAKLVNVGDVLYALYGATSGQVSIARISGAINQAILCIRSNQNHLFIYYFLMFEKHKIIQTFLQGGQGNLSAEIIKSLEIPIPSQEEQKKIANFLSAIDIKINLVETQLKKTQEFKKGLLQQMFI